MNEELKKQYDEYMKICQNENISPMSYAQWLENNIFAWQSSVEFLKRQNEALKAFVKGIAENTPRSWNKDANVDWLQAQAYVLFVLGQDARVLIGGEGT